MFYILLVLCMTAAWLSDVCHVMTYALVMAYIGLGALCEWRQKKYPRVAKILGVALFFALFVIDIKRGGGLQAMFLSACLNIVWTLIGYRALQHEKTADRIQIGVLAVLPLACVAFTMSAVALIAFLVAYFAVLFVYLGRLSLAVPTTGSVACSERMVDARFLRMPGRQFWIKTSLLGLLAFAIGSMLFLCVPRWGSDAISAMPSVQPSRSSFPDVSIDKTGTIQMDPSLMFRVALPKIEQPRYWRIEAQNIFDGKKWRAIGGQRNHHNTFHPDRPTYRLEFVREWRDFRVPTLYGTEAVRRLEQGEDQSKIRFYPDAADIWHRWGWGRRHPLMGIEFQLQNDASPSHGALTQVLQTTRAFLQKIEQTQDSKKTLPSLDEQLHLDNIAYRERDQGRLRTYFQKTAPQNAPRFSITVPAEERQPFHDVAWTLITRLHQDLKEIPPHARKFEDYEQKPMFHQSTAMFWPERIWPGRKKGSESVQRMQNLARKIVGNAQDNETKAMRMRDYLREHYTYSLERPERRDPIVEDFLFDQKFGHCEMFSTTMAVLLASIDVPVRNVSGFVSDEYSDGMHHVRAAHAHSWVEVYLDDTRGWTTFDPTPPGATAFSIDWLVRIDDWFTSYQTRDLYTWLAKYGWILGAILLMCFGLGWALRWPYRAIRRRLQPTKDVWQWAWQDLMQQCKKNPQTQALAQRTLEDWWTQNDHTIASQFARDYINARYQRPVEPQNSTAVWQRFGVNHKILCRQNEVVRDLKKSNRAPH